MWIPLSNCPVHLIRPGMHLSLSGPGEPDGTNIHVILSVIDAQTVIVRALSGYPTRWHIPDCASCGDHIDVIPLCPKEAL